MRVLQFSTGDWVIWCPGCRRPHVIDTRWTFNSNFVNPTFNPSLHINPDDDTYRCHSFIRDGNIQFLNDSYHTLKGQTVPLPEIVFDEAGYPILKE